MNDSKEFMINRFVEEISNDELIEFKKLIEERDNLKSQIDSVDEKRKEIYEKREKQLAIYENNYNPEFVMEFARLDATNLSIEHKNLNNKYYELMKEYNGLNSKIKEMYSKMVNVFIGPGSDIRVRLMNSYKKMTKKEIELNKRLAELKQTISYKINLDPDAEVSIKNFPDMSSFPEVREEIDKISGELASIKVDLLKLRDLGESYGSLCLFVEKLSVSDFIDYIRDYEVVIDKVQDSSEDVKDTINEILGKPEKSSSDEKIEIPSNVVDYALFDDEGKENDNLDNEKYEKEDASETIVSDNPEVVEVDEPEEIIEEELPLPDRTRWQSFKSFVKRNKVRIISGVLAVAAAAGILGTVHHKLKGTTELSSMPSKNNLGIDIDKMRNMLSNDNQADADYVDLTVGDNDYTSTIDENDPFVNSEDYDEGMEGIENPTKLAQEEEQAIAANNVPVGSFSDSVNNGDFIELGSKVNIETGVPIYSNIYDVYYNRNAKPAYFGAGERTVIGASVEYGGKIYTIYASDKNANDTIQSYLSNGGTIVGYLTTVKDASNIKSINDVGSLAEGFYSADSVSLGKGLSR